MSVGFGFSAGDFIAALELVATVVDALRESGLASTQYRGLVSQLDLLETALRKVNRVELDDNQYAEGIALRQAAAQCRRTIEEFWKKNVKKYEPSLRAGGSGNGLRDGWMKIKWALCEKEDLAKFKTDLIGHTESINLLLTTIQMAATRIEGKKNEQYHKTLAGKVQDSYFGCMQRMSVVFEQVTTGIRHSKKLLKMTAEVIQTNIQIFQIVLDIQNLITRIPGQVERQQPVLLIDAIGRHAPFHLEFILSAEALVSVLQSNFKNIGSGARRIRDGKFAIQDLSTNRDVDLSAPWETCFHPGQRVEMSMVFRNCHKNFSFSCPKCRHSPGDDFGDTDKDIECPNCAMIYRRFSILPIQHFDDFSSPPVLVEDSRDIAPADEEVSPQPVIPFKRKLPYSDEEELTELALFRRVRLKSEWGRVPQHSQTSAQQLEQRRLIALLREIQNHDAAQPFLLPLSIDDAGDYYDVIKEPMNLITMGQKLEDHCYQGPEDFVRDAKLIFNNCRKYYSETTPYAKSANRLEKFLWQQIRSIPEWQHLEP